MTTRRSFLARLGASVAAIAAAPKILGAVAPKPARASCVIADGDRMGHDPETPLSRTYFSSEVRATYYAVAATGDLVAWSDARGDESRAVFATTRRLSARERKKVERWAKRYHGSRP